MIDVYAIGYTIGAIIVYVLMFIGGYTVFKWIKKYLSNKIAEEEKGVKK